MRARQLWGTDVYTADSDLVAVLVHTGFYALPPSTSPPTPPAGLVELRAVLRPLPPQPSYASTARHGLRSRAWGGGAPAAPGAPAAVLAYRVERCSAVTSGGGIVVLEPMRATSDAGGWAGPPAPTFALTMPERAGGGLTRGAAADAARRSGRLARVVTVLYSLTHEPWLKYGVAAVADRSLAPQNWTAARLRCEVLYLESHSKRYELAWEGLIPGRPAWESAQARRRAAAAGQPVQGDGSELDAYRWSTCRTPLALEAAREVGAPLPSAELEPSLGGVRWEDLLWSPRGAALRGGGTALCEPLVRLQWLPACEGRGAA